MIFGDPPWLAGEDTVGVILPRRGESVDA